MILPALLLSSEQQFGFIPNMLLTNADIYKKKNYSFYFQVINEILPRSSVPHTKHSFV